jgi:hypothetical protein
MIDCIAGYHLNPWTCGIAKFNAILAGHLALPVVGIGSSALVDYRRPLLSVKLSEFTPDDAGAGECRLLSADAGGTAAGPHIHGRRHASR